MTTQLRDYQQRALDEARAHVLAGRRAVCVVLPTGAGKTRVGAEFVLRHIARGGRVLWLAHRRELVQQAAGRVIREGVPSGDVRVILSGRALGRPDAPVTVAGVQTLLSRAKTNGFPPATLVVFDECFPSTALIGGRPICDLRAGDSVPSWDHERDAFVLSKVAHVMKKKATQLVTVHTSRGKTTCTPNHPFFAFDRGYVRAGDLVAGDEVACGVFVQLHDVQHGFSSTAPQPEGDAVLLARVCESCHCCEKIGEGTSRQLLHVRCRNAGPHTQRAGEVAAQSRVLLDCLPGQWPQSEAFSDDVTHEQNARRGTDDSQQPDGENRRAGEDGRDAEAHWAPTPMGRREGSRNDYAAAGFAQSARCGLGDGVAGVGRRQVAAGSAQELLHRHREPGAHDCGRNRRRESQDDQVEEERRATNGSLERVRVDRVEVHEPGSDGTFGGLCPDGHVYNLDVEGTHVYFADGFLVHNCHHYVAEQWRALADHYAPAIRLGLTATPQRGDGSPLGDIFDAIVATASVSQLTDLGHLVPCAVIAPARRRKPLASSPVEAYRTHTPGERAVVFCANVPHSKAVAEEFAAAGIPAAHVDGGTSTRDRDAALADFAAGRILVVTNVYVLTEGWDQPATQACILARGCNAVGTYLQMVGRVLRPAPGKTHATLVDLRGMVHVHGLPDAERALSLDGAGIATTKADADAIASCAACGAVFRPTSRRTCPKCCAQLPEPQRPEIRAERLVRVSGDTVHTDEMKRRYFDSLVRNARGHGYKAGWIGHRFKAQFGHWPVWPVVCDWDTRPASASHDEQEVA